jgi:hypothetical protein
MFSVHVIDFGEIAAQESPGHHSGGGHRHGGRDLLGHAGRHLRHIVGSLDGATRRQAQPLRATQPRISLADVNPPLPDPHTGAKAHGAMAHGAKAQRQKWEGTSPKNVRWPPLVTPHAKFA